MWGRIATPYIPYARKILRYRQKGFQFSQAFKAGHWDGWKTLVATDGRYPAGLTNLLVQRLGLDLGEEIAVEDKRAIPQPCGPLSAVSLRVTLEEHQRQAVLDAERMGQGVIQHPTGAGKSIVIAALVQRFGVPALILCHRKDLMYQLADTMRKSLDVPALVGVMGDGQIEPNWITVATVQTASRYIAAGDALSRRIGLVIVDEAHHTSADSFAGVLQALSAAYYRFGVSATAHREGDEETELKVTGWLGPVISHLSSSGGVETGRIVPADIYLLEPGPPDPDCSDWPTAYRTGVVEHRNRNRIVTELAVRSAKKGLVLILCDRLKHALTIERSFQERGVKYALITGQHDSVWRQRVLDGARSGELDVLIASTILDEGIDLPTIRTLILAGAGKAPHKLIQRIGRGMRASEGKLEVTVFDFADKGIATYWDRKEGKRKQRPGQLVNQSKSRRKTYEAEPAYTVTDVSFSELQSWLSL